MTMDEHLLRRRLYGGLETPAQRTAARRRAQRVKDEAFRISWLDTDVWRVPGEREIQEYPIGQLEDRHLWQTVNWMVRNAVQLYQDYGTKAPLSDALSSCLWLREQPLFRALLKEAIRRDFTFPPDVYRYLKQYVVDRSGTLDGFTPWQDPAQAEQSEALQPFLDQSLLPPEIEYGKQRRCIQLD